jgi:hypothetical protein
MVDIAPVGEVAFKNAGFWYSLACRLHGACKLPWVSHAGALLWNKNFTLLTQDVETRSSTTWRKYH